MADKIECKSASGCYVLPLSAATCLSLFPSQVSIHCCWWRRMVTVIDTNTDNHVTHLSPPHIHCAVQHNFNGICWGFPLLLCNGVQIRLVQLWERVVVALLLNWMDACNQVIGQWGNAKSLRKVIIHRREGWSVGDEVEQTEGKELRKNQLLRAGQFKLGNQTCQLLSE